MVQTEGRRERWGQGGKTEMELTENLRPPVAVAISLKFCCVQFKGWQGLTYPT